MAITIDDTARNPFFFSTKAKSSSAAVTLLIFFLYIFMVVHEEGESGARMCEEEHLVFIFFLHNFNGSVTDGASEASILNLLS